MVREDLRLSLSHGHLLDQLLQEIARSEREIQTSPTEEKYLFSQERQSSKQQQMTERQLVDEYGFSLDDGEEEQELSLTRTQSRRTST